MLKVGLQLGNSRCRFSIALTKLKLDHERANTRDDGFSAGAIRAFDPPHEQIGMVNTPKPRLLSFT
ncbi:MAG TPA: hypothetical protein VNZ85_07080 [Caulobacter sp.]|nr:hypothetical protein [Caulobacter sp.]